MPQEATVHVDQLNKIIRSKIIQQQELLFWARVPNTHLETSEQSYTCKQVKRKKRPCDDLLDKVHDTYRWCIRFGPSPFHRGS